MTGTSHGRRVALLIPWFVVGALAPQAWGQTPDPTPTPTPSPPVAITFPAQVERVIVDAVVSDKQGNPVPGLTRNDFEVREDGRPQTIQSFQAIQVEEGGVVTDPSEPELISTNDAASSHASRTFVVVFDDLNLTSSAAEHAKQHLARFIKTIFRPGDLVMLVPTAGGAGWTARMPAGATELQVVLNRLTGYRRPSTAPDRISDYEAMRIHLYRDDEVAALVGRRVARTGLYFGDLEQGRDVANVMGVQDIAADVFEQVRTRNRTTLTKLARIVGSLSSGLGRKSVILISDGFVHDPGLEEFKWVTQAALAANAAIYFVNARGLETAPTVVGAEEAGPRSTSTEATAAASYRDIGRTMFIAGQESEGANVLASDSGGFTVRGTSKLADGLWRIVRESRIYYLIGYAPTNTERDGKFRKIEVKVARGGLKVRARKGYYIAKQGEPLTGAPDAADGATRQRLTSPFEEQAISLRMTTYALGRSTEDRVRVLLAAEADPAAVTFAESGTRSTGRLESTFDVASLETGLLFQTERKVDLDLAADVRGRLARTWIPVSGSFDLPPGSYQAKLLVRDPQGERVGTIHHAFDVPPVDRLRISTPILTDTFQASPGGASLPSTPVPLARRSFALGVQLELMFEVYEAMLETTSGRPRVKLTYGVQRAGGPEPKLRTQRMFADREGLLSQRIKIPLRGIPPGDYAVVLTVTDEVSGESVDWREPFVVEAPGASGPAGPGSP